MSDTGKGIAAILAANLIWGLSPIYYKMLAHVPPLEVLSHRTIWSLVFFGIVLLFQRRLAEVPGVLRNRRALAQTALATAMISINWFLFIWSIQLGQAVQASMGYYIFPLVTVLFGVLFFGETLGRAKLVAIGLAVVAVTVLTVGLGRLPAVSLVLAFSFGIYSVVKKNTVAGPVVSVTAEVALVVPLSLIWLWGVHNLGWTGVSGRNLATFGHSLSDSLLLMLSGPLTAGPLILFSLASRRLNLSTVGLVQYLNPTLQFLVAVLVFAEPFTRWHAIAFPLIWAALVVYTVQALRHDRSSRRAAISAGTSGTVEMNSLSDGSAKP